MGKWQRLKLIHIQNGGEKPALSDGIQKEEARLWDSQNVIWLTQRLNELTGFQIKKYWKLTHACKHGFRLWITKRKWIKSHYQDEKYISSYGAKPRSDYNYFCMLNSKW